MALQGGLAAGILGLVLSALLLASGLAEAQSSRAPGSAPSSSPPVLFSADELQTEEDLGLVVAKGHVQISQGLQTLLADVVTYNQRTDTITASGHVSLQQPTGEILFADFMELTDRMQNGFMQNVRALLSDRSRLAANAGRRTNGVHTEMRRGVYSPCDLCKEDPSRPPTWQLRAETIVHDEETHRIEYRDAVMEIGGFPVFYTPYLSQPDPTVKRQSGLLLPTFGNSSTLGAHATIPYFWAIAPDRDVTFAPTFTSSQGVVLDADYRQRFSNGETRSQASLNNGKSPDNGGTALRGHIDSVSRFSLTENWRSGLDLERASDQTYERVFHFGGTQNFLTSRGFAERFTRTSYFDVENYTFQTLRQSTSDSNQPIVTPLLDYRWVGDPDRFGGRLSAEGDLLNLNRLRGTGSHRLSLGTAWTKPFSGLVGDVFTFTTSVRGDGYQTSDIALSPNEPPRNAGTGRVYPQAALEWRYPWLRQGEVYSQVIEPIAMFVAGANGGNPAAISNEDSLAFDYNETQLFVPNRFAGFDQVDPADRVDYGLRAAIYPNRITGYGPALSMLIGQSYRFQNTGTFPTGSGLEDKHSDIVGRFVLSPNQYIDTVYRYRLSHKGFAVIRQEAGINGGPPMLRLGVSFIKLPPDLVSNDPSQREQIGLSALIGLSRYWNLTLATTRNLGNSGTLGTISSSINATYQDECLAFIAQLSQSGVSDRDIKPGASIVFSVVFKNLGEVTAPSIATTGIR